MGKAELAPEIELELTGGAEVLKRKQ